MRDNAGALLALLESAGGDPPDEPPPTGAWLWAELFTLDRAAASPFYVTLLDFQQHEVRDWRGEVFHVWTRDGRPRAGVIEVDWEGLEQSWLPYVRVADLTETLAQALALGGRVILREANVAVIVDPTGAVIGVQSPAATNE